MATNQYEFDLVEELKEELGGSSCMADWGEFWDELKDADKRAKVSASEIYLLNEDERECAIDVASEEIATYAKGTRAELPSLIKYIWEQIEIELKELEA